MPPPTPIDITTIPELARIAEEVEATQTGRELKRENKTVAVIMPVKKAPAKKKREKTKADYEAFKSAAGGWKDIDTDNVVCRNNFPCLDNNFSQHLVIQGAKQACSVT